MNLVEHPHGGGNHQQVNASVVAPCLLPRKRTSRSFLPALIPLSLVVETTVRGVEHDIR